MSPQMAVSARGLYFVVTLFLGSFFGSIFMLGPVLPLMFLSPAWYRWITDRIVATWLTLPVVSTPSSHWLGPLKTASLNLLFLSISSSSPLTCLTSPISSLCWNWYLGSKWWSRAMASSQVREVWSSWTIAPVWTGCSCGAVCSGTATFAWRRSASRLRWRLCPALVGVLVLSFTLFFSATQKSPHWLLVHPSSRLGYAGGLLRLHSAPLGGGQEAHGEHAGLLLRHQRAAAAAALPWRHRSHRWEGNNATSTFSPRRFQLLFSELDIQQHLSCTFALMPLCKYHFQMLKRCQILPGTPRQLFLKMLWSFNPCSSSTTDA